MAPDLQTERTLYELARCTPGEERRDPGGVGIELMDAILEGLARGWVGHAELWQGKDDETHIAWRATRAGEREVSAFMRRHAPRSVDGGQS